MSAEPVSPYSSTYDPRILGILIGIHVERANRTWATAGFEVIQALRQDPSSDLFLRTLERILLTGESMTKDELFDRMQDIHQLLFPNLYPAN